MGRSIGETGDAARYDEAAERLRQGVLTIFTTIHPEAGLPVLAGSMEELLDGKPCIDLRLAPPTLFLNDPATRPVPSFRLTFQGPYSIPASGGTVTYDAETSTPPQYF